MNENIKDFFERIKSFSVQNWFSKQVTPYKCAQYGFINSNLDEITCSFCEAKLTYDKNIEQFLQKMNSCHQDACVYKDTLKSKIKLNMIYSEWETFYQYNLQSLENLEYIELNMNFLNLIPQNIQQVFYQNQKFNFKIALAIFGWNFNNNKLECNFCGRSEKVSEFTTDMDILKEHRYFCKWGRMKNNQKIYGWNICLNMLNEQNKQKQGLQNIFDKKNEIQNIKLEIQKNLEEINKIQETCKQSYDIVLQKSKQYNFEKNDKFKELFNLEFFKQDNFIEEFKNKLENLNNKKVKLN